jgi:predicted nucleic acid-binding protein
VSLYGSGAALVFDTSAFARRRDPDVGERWEASGKAGLLAVCPVVTLEILTVARDEESFRRLDASLVGIPLRAPVTEAVGAAALGAARELGGSRRIPAADYLIAAAAAARGFGVLHDDRHFDLLAGVLGFDSVRV